jgi:hypothetical protein
VLSGESTASRKALDAHYQDVKEVVPSFIVKASYALIYNLCWENRAGWSNANKLNGGQTTFSKSASISTASDHILSLF